MKLVRVSDLPPISKETSDAMEGSYRRGYSQGYAQAVEDIRRMKSRGFNRVQEVFNILDWHQSFIWLWRMHRNPYESTWCPPILRQESWGKLRAKIFAEHGKWCALCGSTEDLQIDHIEPVKHGGLPDPDNLRVLCRTHNIDRNRN